MEIWLYKPSCSLSALAGLLVWFEEVSDLFIHDLRLANHPGMAEIVPELTHGVRYRVPGKAHFVPEMWILTTGHGYMAVH